MAVEIYIAEDNLIRVDKLRLSSSGSYVNTGTATMVLKDAAGDTIASGSLAYVSASSGRWQGTLDAADLDTLTPGDLYTLEITLTSSGADGFRRIECLAVYHNEQ